MSTYVPVAVRRHWTRVARLGCVLCGGPAEIAHCHGGSVRERLQEPKAKGKKLARLHYLVLPLCPPHGREPYPLALETCVTHGRSTLALLAPCDQSSCHSRRRHSRPTRRSARRSRRDRTSRNCRLRRPVRVAVAVAGRELAAVGADHRAHRTTVLDVRLVVRGAVGDLRIVLRLRNRVGEGPVDVLGEGAMLTAKLNAHEVAEFDVLAHMNTMGKFVVPIGAPLCKYQQDALERLMLRDWIRLIDIDMVPTSGWPGLVRVFLAMPAAVSWYEQRRGA